MIAFAVPEHCTIIKAMKGKQFTAMCTYLPFYSVHYNPVLWFPLNQLARKTLTRAISPTIGYGPFTTFGEVGAIRSGECLMYIHYSKVFCTGLFIFYDYTYVFY